MIKTNVIDGKLVRLSQDSIPENVSGVRHLIKTSDVLKWYRLWKQIEKSRKENR